MPVTETWKTFGDSIQEFPAVTLAAYLGDEASIQVANQRKIAFPTLEDFKQDPKLDPNSHNLDLTPDYVESQRLMKTIILWGKEPVCRAVNALSLLQLSHQTECEDSLRTIRDDAAFALCRYVDKRTEENRRGLVEQLSRCNKPYGEHEHRPDEADAETVWYHLGATWFGIESVWQGWSGQRDIENEHEIPQAHSTFCNRLAVWPGRTIDAAAHWSSDQLAQAVVKSALLKWATAVIRLDGSDEH